MSALEIQLDAHKLEQALHQAPGALARELDKAVFRIAIEIANEARRNAPKAFSVLTNSILASRTTALVSVVKTGSLYARMVEQGTGPGGWPDIWQIERWMRVKDIAPRDPQDTERDAAYKIARSIALHGTPKQPFLGPALEAKRARADELADKAIDRALGLA